MNTMDRGTVLLDWVTMLSWKQQSTLLSALRGPDLAAPAVKRVSRWLRAATQNCGDSSSGYMRQEELPSSTELELELLFLPTHFTLHFLYGLEIVGYHHPDAGVAEKARSWYTELVQRFHLHPESMEEIDVRLQDKM